MEENLYPFVKLVAGVLSDRPLFFLINSYTTGLAPSVLTYILETLLTKRYGGHTVSDELGLPVAESGLILPCAPPADGRRLGNKEHPMSTMIKAEHLTFRYPDEPADHPPVLDDINLEIAAGSFVAILGAQRFRQVHLLPSTAMPCSPPPRGNFGSMGWTPLTRTTFLAIRGTVGMVFQNPDNQIVASVVEEDVAFGPENMGIPPKRSENGWTLPSKWSGCMNGVSTPRTCSPAGKSSGWPLPASSP